MQHGTQTALAMAITILAALSTLGACSGKKGASGTGSGTGTSAPGVCDDLAQAVRSLYAATDAATPEAGDESPEVRAELLEANVHMVISDCETAPASFKPCIRAAKTVAELESSCTVPLDDEGTVEGRQFL